MPSFFFSSPPGWMFSAALMPQIKRNYDRNTAFSSQEQDPKGLLTRLGCLALGSSMNLSQGQDALPCSLGVLTPWETLDHVSPLLRHFWAILYCFFMASSWLCLFLTLPSQSPLQRDRAQFIWGSQGLIFPVAALPFWNLQQVRLDIKMSRPSVCFSDRRPPKTGPHKSK